jgi:hypothetical protein
LRLWRLMALHMSSLRERGDPNLNTWAEISLHRLRYCISISSSSTVSHRWTFPMFINVRSVSKAFVQIIRLYSTSVTTLLKNCHISRRTQTRRSSGLSSPGRLGHRS